jgi:Zn-dependent peptidase ImmA (M78 family)
MSADVIRRLYDAAGLAWPPSSKGPVPLDRLIAAYNLAHEEVPGLTRAAAAVYLARWGVRRPELRADETALAGFLFANARGGAILVRQDDPLPRRRFTAAHELGHYLLHFLPRLRPEESFVQDDEADTVCEEEKAPGADGLSLPEMERQANRFAAELLMPEAVCRELRDRFPGPSGPVARFLEHQLAGELLVSRAAARWRLRGLGRSARAEA